MLHQVFSRTPGQTLNPQVFFLNPDKNESTAGKIEHILVKIDLRKPEVPKGILIHSNPTEERLFHVVQKVSLQADLPDKKSPYQVHQALFLPLVRVSGLNFPENSLGPVL